MEVIKPVEVESKPEYNNPEATEGSTPSVAKIKLESFFGLHNPNQIEADSLSEIVRILDGDNKDPIDFLWEIKQIESRIGTPPLGVSRIQHLRNFISIHSQMNRLQKQLDVYGQ